LGGLYVVFVVMMCFVVAPILTHFVWTLVVLLGLPPLFGL